MSSRIKGISVGIIFSLSIICSLQVFAEVRLPNILSDNMVLQRDKPVKIWGWANPGESIQVIGSWQAKDIMRTVADESGNWKVMISPQKAGGPYTLSIQGENKIELSNILFGEVWVCSGQSNMNYILHKADGGEEAARTADFPEIRLLNIETEYSVEEMTDIKTKWKVCSPESVKEFTAVGFFFGRYLHMELNVPIGLISSNVGGTSAELWTQADSLSNKPVLEPIIERWEESDERNKQLFTDGVNFELVFDNFILNPRSADAEPVILDDFEDEDLSNKFMGSWEANWSTEDETSSIEFTPGNEDKGKAIRLTDVWIPERNYPLKVSLDPDGNPIDLNDFESISFDVRGDGFFKLLSIQPSITDGDDYASKVYMATDEWQNVTVNFKDLRQAYWGVLKAYTQDEISTFIIQSVSGFGWAIRPPGSLYNGMIAPLTDYNIRGALWYQGEGNAGRAFQYRTLLPTLIRSWRSSWDQGDFPFLIVQLPNLGKEKDQPGENDWAELREAQFMALQLPQTGLAVTIDVGNPIDVHPSNKYDVGKRLALWALGDVYEKKIVYSGPLYNTMEIINDEIIVRFKHTGSSLIAKGGSMLKGFAVAGEDRGFHWAEARIENDRVILSSKNVPNPVAVRYGWAGNPDCNLYNSADLPASPFRTDNWPGRTVDNY